MEKKPYQLSDYLNAINNTKENLMDTDDPAWKKKYPAFIVNAVQFLYKYC